MGRVPSIRDEQIEVLCRNLRLRVPIRDALILAGIPMATHFHWLTRARDPDQKYNVARYREYEQRVERASAEGVGALLALIAQAARPTQLTTRKETRKPARAPGGGLLRDADGVIIYEVTVEESSREVRQWQAAAWILERTNRDEFARRWVLDTDAAKLLPDGADDAAVAAAEANIGAAIEAYRLGRADADEDAGRPSSNGGPATSHTAR
jgi:hypothetical protein